MSDDKHVVHMPHKDEKLVIDENYEFYPKSILKRFWFSLCYALASVLLFVFNKGYYGLKIKGRKNLRAAKKQSKTGIITVSNHINILDCLMNSSVIFPMRMEFTTIQDNFLIPFAGKIIKTLGGVPIPNEPSRMRYFQRYVTKRLQENHIMHYYPEGVLRPYSNKIHEFSRGAFVQAEISGCAVVPIVYAQRKPRGWFWLIRRKKCAYTVIVLPAMEIDKTLARRDGILDLSERVRSAMTETLQKYSVYEVKPK